MLNVYEDDDRPAWLLHQILLSCEDSSQQGLMQVKRVATRSADRTAAMGTPMAVDIVVVDLKGPMPSGQDPQPIRNPAHALSRCRGRPASTRPAPQGHLL
ncbi:hypothetical protein AB0J68_30895 [Micromonospora sp. NPDC049580]|uniref:hypothetical protein n=1 Tax=Micromonospora sp. NPDC049580 TaxID=3154832 RepID=UPI003419A461